MRNIDITEWLLDNHIDSDTEIVMDGKQVFLADVLEKHLKEQFAISDVINSRIKELEEENKKLHFMIKNALGYEDMVNDCG